MISLDACIYTTVVAMENRPASEEYGGRKKLRKIALASVLCSFTCLKPNEGRCEINKTFFVQAWQIRMVGKICREANKLIVTMELYEKLKQESRVPGHACRRESFNDTSLLIANGDYASVT